MPNPSVHHFPLFPFDTNTGLRDFIFTRHFDKPPTGSSQRGYIPIQHLSQLGERQSIRLLGVESGDSSGFAALSRIAASHERKNKHP